MTSGSGGDAGAGGGSREATGTIRATSPIGIHSGGSASPLPATSMTWKDGRNATVTPPPATKTDDGAPMWN